MISITEIKRGRRPTKGDSFDDNTEWPDVLVNMDWNNKRGWNSNACSIIRRKRPRNTQRGIADDRNKNGWQIAKGTNHRGNPSCTALPRGDGGVREMQNNILQQLGEQSRFNMIRTDREGTVEGENCVLDSHLNLE